MNAAPRRRATWTTEDDDFLKDHWGVLSPAACADRLGRTVVACMVRKKRLGIAAHDNLLTGRVVARMFGVDSHMVGRWVAAHLLRARRGGVAYGPHRIWNVSHQALERFLAEHPEEYDWRRMEPGYYRNRARAIWQADPLLTVPEVAALHGVSLACIRCAIRAGRLPARRSAVAGINRPWRVKRSDALTFAPVRPELVGHRGRGKGKAA